MKKFKFTEKETYTLSEVKDFLNQHKEFMIKDYVLKEDYLKLEEELKPLKANLKEQRILELVKDITDSDKIKDAISLANLSEDIDDETIVSKVKEVVKSRKYLQKTIETPEIKSELSSAKHIKEPTSQPEYKFIRSWDTK